MMDSLEAVRQTIEHLRASVVSAYRYNESAIAEMWKRRDQGNGWQMFEKTQDEELEERRINDEVTVLQGEQSAYRQVLIMLDAEVSRIVSEHLVSTAIPTEGANSLADARTELVDKSL